MEYEKEKRFVPLINGLKPSNSQSYEIVNDSGSRNHDRDDNDLSYAAEVDQPLLSKR